MSRPIGRDDAASLRMKRREEKILALLRAGKSDAQIGKLFSVSPRTLADIIARLRREHGIEPPHTRKWRRLVTDDDLRDMLRECEQHLGEHYVRQYLGRATGQLDEGDSVALQRLHAALRYDLMDAADLVPQVRARLRERSLLRLNHDSQGARE